MGTGIASGENRAEEAIETALNSPLLNNNDIRGARNILVNITSGSHEVTMAEVGMITDYVQNKAGFDADLIWGNGKEESLGENLSVTIIATGFSTSIIPELNKESQSKKISVELSENRSVKKEVVSESEGKSTERANQKFIEFNISEEKKKEENDFEALYPETTKERHKVEDSPVEEDYTAMSEEDVDNMENIPAYLRRKLRMNDPRFKKQKSNYSVSSDNEISDKNNYIYKNVD